MKRSIRSYDHWMLRLTTFTCGAATASILARVDFSWEQLSFFHLRAHDALYIATTYSHPHIAAMAFGIVMFGFLAILCSSLAARMPTQRASFRKTAPTNQLGDKLDQEKLHTINLELEAQIADIARLVNVYLEASIGQNKAVAQAHCTISKADTLDQVRQAVQILIKVNAETARDAEALRDNLREAKHQAEKLQTKLASVEKLALTDGLTLVANRRCFDDFLDRSLRQSHITKTPLTVVFADLDHFKKINDRFGHPAGDQVLKSFASLLSKNVRSTDLVARLGGEEFAIVLPDTPVGNATVMVERIQYQMGVSFCCGNDDAREIGAITASFGITEVVDDDTSKDVIKRADEMLYCAKRNGRNRFEISKINIRLPQVCLDDSNYAHTRNDLSPSDRNPGTQTSSALLRG